VTDKHLRVDQKIRVADGRTVGFADYGPPGSTAVLWCHGGPGSRLEPAFVREQAVEAGLRIIGIDRPGYGLSTPQPGRTIAGWVPEALAIADHLGIDRFVTVGVSTGGAFALAVAALAPDRVLGVVACCSMTDMRWPEGRATMSRAHAHAVWDAPDRAAAIAAAVDAHGENGSKMLGGGMDAALCPTDLAMFRDPAWMKEAMAGFPSMFTYGLEGYTDDRLADGPGWITFAVESIRCPVTVLHGGEDRMVDVIHARHTTEIVPNAELLVFDDLGHFSIEYQVVPAITQLLTRRRIRRASSTTRTAESAGSRPASPPTPPAARGQ
jgi:pimeloyl-ACP methyl ester carboxylesterase